MHAAVRLDEENKLKLLIDRGGNVNAKDPFGKTPLHRAVKYGRCGISKLLIDAGADLYEHDVLRRTPFMIDVEILREAKRFYSSESTNATFDKKKVIKCLNQVTECVDVNLLNNQRNNIMMIILLEEKNFYYHIILQYIAKLKVLNLQVDQYLIAFIRSSRIYSKYFRKCLQELEMVRRTRLPNCWITFFNLLVDSESKLIKYAGNEDLVGDLKRNVEKFPIYGNFMENNLDDGIEGRKSYDKAAYILSSSLPIFNPQHLIITDTLDTLRLEHMKKLCE